MDFPFLFHVIIGVSYFLLCHVEFYFWILLALDLGSRRAGHSYFFCSKFTLAVHYSTMESDSYSLKLLLFFVDLRDLTGFMPLFEEYFEQYLTSESIPFFLSSLAFGLLVGSTIGIGTFWFVALITRERGEIYKGTLLYSGAIIFSCVCVYALDILDSHIAHWMLVVYTLHALFMVYLVVYSQEILYDARFGDIDFVNCTFTVFLHLPAIVVHAVRLCLGAEIQQHRRN
ncbi:hypothetical protein H5410_012287 [Solanum commersonii]|uniref:Uncharacterized protein n=1 Tax=Solanum commersonii TaxID=4109 RepID=A0A9J6AR36_SOLCO|nr:hypothetical protein H5410_012287 [Solanum commersonii]